MNIEEKFPIGCSVRVNEVYIDEEIYRMEGVDKLSDLDRKNISRLIGSVGKVVGYDATYGFTAHQVIVVEFYNEEAWMFSELEIEITDQEPSKTSPILEEVVDYQELTEDETHLAQKVLLTCIASYDECTLKSTLYNKSKVEDLVGESIAVSLEFYKQTSLLWSKGIKFEPKNDW